MTAWRRALFANQAANLFVISGTFPLDIPHLGYAPGPGVVVAFGSLNGGAATAVSACAWEVVMSASSRGSLVLAFFLAVAAMAGDARALVVYDPTSVIYHWVPIPNQFVDSKGKGFIKFDTTGQTPDNFVDLVPIDFMFDFEDSGIPVITFGDVQSLGNWDAVNGKLDPVNDFLAGPLQSSGAFFSETGLVVNFDAFSSTTQPENGRADASCVVLGTICSSLDQDGLRAENDGIWVLWLPEPATLTLFGFGLAGLGLAVRRRRLAR